jgi:hypothetical protein
MSKNAYLKIYFNWQNVIRENANESESGYTCLYFLISVSSHLFSFENKIYQTSLISQNLNVYAQNLVYFTFYALKMLTLRRVFIGKVSVRATVLAMASWSVAQSIETFLGPMF